MSTRLRKPILQKLSELDKAEAIQVAALDVAVIIETLGTDTFSQALLDFGVATIKADFMSIFCLGDDKTPLLIDTKCTVGNSRAQLAVNGYKRHFEDDVDFQLMKPGSVNDDYTTYQNRNDVKQLQYRRDCYDMPGIADRRSAVRKRAGYALSVSFYRSTEVGEFDNSDRHILDGLLPMLLALTERHVAFHWKGKIATINNNEAQLAISYPGLTKREREVTSMSIKGMTAAQIAESLGVAETTIITHRNKAYQRLGVSSLRELMRL